MYDIFIMDLGGHNDNVQGLVERFPHAKVVRYYDNHLDTLIQIPLINSANGSASVVLPLPGSPHINIRIILLPYMFLQIC